MPCNTAASSSGSRAAAAANESIASSPERGSRAAAQEISRAAGDLLSHAVEAIRRAERFGAAAEHVHKLR